MSMRHMALLRVSNATSIIEECLPYLEEEDKAELVFKSSKVIMGCLPSLSDENIQRLSDELKELFLAKMASASNPGKKEEEKPAEHVEGEVVEEKKGAEGPKSAHSEEALTVVM